MKSTTTHYLESATVVETRQVAERTFLTEFRSPSIAAVVQAGQFVMASFPGCIDPLLPRAFSVCETAEDRISLFYVAVGRGTIRLSKLRRGETVILNGPLGNGFPKLSRGENVWIAVGGSGAAVLPILISSVIESGTSCTAFYGARTKTQLLNFNHEAIQYATDDGTAGFHGTVVELLKNGMLKEKPDKIFACGPTPMLVAVQKEFAHRIKTYVSVETPMACGMGLCQGCPVKRKGEKDYFLACKDGPVFDASEIEFERAS